MNSFENLDTHCIHLEAKSTLFKNITLIWKSNNLKFKIHDTIVPVTKSWYQTFAVTYDHRLTFNKNPLGNRDKIVYLESDNKKSSHPKRGDGMS